MIAYIKVYVQILIKGIAFPSHDQQVQAYSPLHAVNATPGGVHVLDSLEDNLTSGYVHEH